MKILFISDKFDDEQRDEVSKFPGGAELTNALLIAGIQNGMEGEVFNLGSGIGKSFMEMAEKIVEITGSGKIIKIPCKY